MKVYIFGAGDLGQYVAGDLLVHKWEILGYIDNDVNKIGNYIGGQKIYGVQDIPLETRRQVCTLVAIANEKIQAEILLQLEQEGFRDIYLVVPLVMQYETSIVKNNNLDNRYAIKVIKNKNGDFLPVLSYLETHIMDGCCLNCSGCSHFSNLFSMNSEVSLGQFKKDMEQLGKMCNVKRFRLLGGEPLLNRNLLEYLKTVRENFPYAGIRVVTNGLLILKTPKNVFDYMAEQNIELIITMYQPAYEMKDKIMEYLHYCGVEYIMTKENCDIFDKVLTLNDNHDEKKIIEACRRKTCLILREGKLYRCALSAYVYKFNERFGTDIKSQSIFNIYENSVEQLKELAIGRKIEPVNTCRYCSEHAVKYMWKRSAHPTMDEWLVDEEKNDASYFNSYSGI